MNKTTKKLNEITDGDPIKILEFLEKNKNIRLKYESSYEDLLFQLKDDKVQVTDGPFEYEHGLLKLKEGFIDLTQQNINYESAFDIFMKWDKPEQKLGLGVILTQENQFIGVIALFIQVVTSMLKG